MRCVRPWLWLSLVMIGCRSAPSEETDGSGDDSPVDTDAAGETDEPDDSSAEDSDDEIIDTDDTSPPEPTLPDRLHVRRWKTVFVDEFNGPVADDDCYDPAATAPQCIPIYWGNEACTGADATVLNGLNHCVWATYEMYNWMDWGRPLGTGINKLDPEEVSVHDGSLWLEAHRLGEEPYDCGRDLGGGDLSNDCPINSGAVMSKPWGDHRGYAQTYGRFEVRAKLPQGMGAWPAHWMLPVDGGWPEAGEIDIMEATANDPTLTSGNFHGGTYDDVTRVHQVVINEHDLGDDRLFNEYHTYAVEWEPGEIRYFIDDIEFAHLLEGTYVPGDIQGGPDNGTLVDAFPLALPDSPFFFILNTSVVPTADFSVEDFRPLKHEIDSVRAMVPCEPEDTDPQCEVRGSGTAKITVRSGMSANRWSPTTSELLPGDFNGDGATDFVVRALTGGDHTFLLLADGRGGFEHAESLSNCCLIDPGTWSVEGRAAITGDFNNDRIDDLILQGRQSPQHTYVLLGRAAGGFAAARAITNTGGMDFNTWSAQSHGAKVGDFNGDSFDDVLLVANTKTDNTLLAISDGTGGIRSVTTITSLGGLNARRWAENKLLIGDFDGTGTDDILLQAHTESAITTLLLGKTTSFSVTNVSYDFGMVPEFWDASARRAHVGDFDGDGKDDLLLQGVASAERSQLLKGGAGGFQPVRTISYEADLTPMEWSSSRHVLHVGDLDGDGVSDILLQPNNAEHETLYIRANRDGGFEEAVEVTHRQALQVFHWSAEYRSLWLRDWDGDGRVDVLMRGETPDDDTWIVYPDLASGD